MKYFFGLSSRGPWRNGSALMFLETMGGCSFKSCWSCLCLSFLELGFLSLTCRGLEVPGCFRLVSKPSCAWAIDTLYPNTSTVAFAVARNQSKTNLHSLPLWQACRFWLYLPNDRQFFVQSSDPIGVQMSLSLKDAQGD